jgi:CheY-like chemotaxis protein/HPt (histidine-containing phosphotransfer) domain-containing protein
MSGHSPIRKLPSVLIIDDDMVSREVVATVLTMTGYLVQTAATGDESLSLLDADTFVPDVILMDTQMPGLSGAPLIQQLRARSRAIIYAISGSEAPESVVNGADGFLMKPIGPEALHSVLQKHSLTSWFPPAPTARLQAELLPPVINRKTLAQLRDIMKESAVREIYAAIVADLAKRRALLDKAIEEIDHATIRRVGHSIKGGCGMAGALELARVGALIEAGSDELEYIRSLMPFFDSASRNLQRMLDAEFSPQESVATDEENK